MARGSGTVILIALSTLLLTAPLRADVREDAKQQVLFGNTVAQRGLWREAIFRWEKAVELDPTYAAAYNNLGIGYEHEGELGKAERAYQKAIALDPKNQQIRQNYEQFREINERAAENSKP